MRLQYSGMYELMLFLLVVFARKRENVKMANNFKTPIRTVFVCLCPAVGLPLTSPAGVKCKAMSFKLP